MKENPYLRMRYKAMEQDLVLYHSVIDRALRKHFFVREMDAGLIEIEV